MVDGSARERELVNLLDADGWAVMRAPSSGSATTRELPDVLAGNGYRVIAIEAKSSAEQPIYLDSQEIDALEYFASNFGASALVGARFNRCEWAFFTPSELYRTPGGNYRVKKEDLDDGLRLEEL